MIITRQQIEEFISGARFDKNSGFSDNRYNDVPPDHIGEVYNTYPPKWKYCPTCKCKKCSGVK